MSLHNGSTQMAHSLDRFGFNSDFEDIAGEAARLDVDAQTLRQYRDWYGEEEVAVITKAGPTAMPAYEFEIRWQIHGEKVRCVRQLTLPFPAPTSQYDYERRGW